MKTSKRFLLENLVMATAVLWLSLTMFTGCATPQKAPGAPPVIAAQVTPAQPAQNVVQVTPATPTAPAVTNIVYMPALPAVTNYIVVSPAGPAVVTNYVPNQAVMTAVNYAQEAAPLVPSPWGNILTGVASLAAIVAGFVAKNKNTQLAAANSASDSHAAAAAAMASVIQSQPALVTQAMTAAGSNGSTAAVATHIASAASPT